MRILDKYILKELAGVFFFGIAAFSSIFIGTDTLFRIARFVTQYGASIKAVCKLFIYSLPGIVVLTFPMSMLLASLLTFGRLSGNSEITAMRSGGISFYRLSLPVFIAALGVSVLAMVLNELVVPQSKAAYERVVRYEIQQNSKPRSQEHIVIKDITDGRLERLTYARRFDHRTNLLETITIQEFEDDHLVRIQHAEKAQWLDNRWIMYNGIINDLSEAGKIQRTLQFTEQVMPISKNPSAISQEQKEPKEMTIKELKQHIKALEREFINTNEYKMELYQRVTIPLACFIFALIGTPLGLQPHRSSSSIGLGLSIIIIFIYYGIMTVSKALGEGGALPPLLAAWIPNIIATIAGGYLLRRAAR